MAPDVSIVLPTRGRPGPLRIAVESLLAQQPPELWELIVVDDGPDRAAPGWLEGLRQAGRLALVRTGGRGAAAARNAGLALARGPAVACIDDDCQAPADWARRLRERLLATGAACVGGRVVADPEMPLPARISQAVCNGFVGALNRDAADAVFLTSNNVAYAAAPLRALGGFDEGFAGRGAEERDLHARLRAAGHRLVYAPDVVVRHRASFGWAGLLRQQAAYGRGARRYYAKDPARRPFAPGEYLRAFGLGSRELAPVLGPVFALGFALSQAAAAWGYRRASR